MIDNLYPQILKRASNPDYKNYRGEIGAVKLQESIHKFNAVARKRQIQILKDELLEQEPFSTSSYTLSERRIPLFKAIGKLLLAIIRSSRYLLP